MDMQDTETNINSDGLDLDFRVESDNLTHALFIDGANGNVGMGISTQALDNTNNASVNLQIAGRGDQNWGGCINLTSENATTVFSKIVSSTTGLDLINTKDTNVRLFTDNTEYMRIHNNGVTSIPSGVALGVAVSANTASNVLDDYEEGTWTPTCSHGTITSTSAVYTKVGNHVTISCWVSGFSDTSTNANLTITGAPFSFSYATPGPVIARFVDQTAITAAFGANDIIFEGVTSANHGPIKYSDINNSSCQIYLSITHKV